MDEAEQQLRNTQEELANLQQFFSTKLANQDQDLIKQRETNQRLQSEVEGFTDKIGEFL